MISIEIVSSEDLINAPKITLSTAFRNALLGLVEIAEMRSVFAPLSLPSIGPT
jgi:hypothetical protein